jgi:hypothetical protein
MSAFICSDYHISALADYATRSMRRSRLYAADRQWEDPEEVFKVLWAENVRSVLYRYPEDTVDTAPGPIGPKGSFDRRVRAQSFNPIDIVKSCHCLEYQSCECPDYRETTAYELLQAIEAMAIRGLPGYDSAAWGLEAPAPRLVTERSQA